MEQAERVIVKNRTVNNRNTDMGKKRNTPDGMALEKPAPHRVTSEHDSESRSTWVPRSPYSWAPYFGVLHFWTLHFWTPNPWALNPRLLLPAAFPNRPVPLHPISPMVFPVFTWTLLIFPFKIFVNPAYILIPHSLSRLIFLVTRFLTALWPLYPYICQIVPGILPCMFPKTAVEMPAVG